MAESGFDLSNFFEKKKTEKRNITLSPKIKGLEKVINTILDILESKGKKIEDLTFSNIITLKEPYKTAVIQYILHNVHDFRVRIHTTRDLYIVRNHSYNMKCGDFLGFELALIIYNGRTPGNGNEEKFGGYPQSHCEHCRQILQKEQELFIKKDVNSSIVATEELEEMSVLTGMIPDEQTDKAVKFIKNKKTIQVNSTKK